VLGDLFCRVRVEAISNEPSKLRGINVAPNSSELNRVRAALLLACIAACGASRMTAQVGSPVVSLEASTNVAPRFVLAAEEPGGIDLFAAQQTPAQQPATPPATAQQPAADTKAGVPDAPTPANASQNNSKAGCTIRPCQVPIINWYMRFENGPQVKPLTPKEKGWLATKNLLDPFNLITILGEAGISVAADSHSAYGPGMPGFGRYVGVSFTEDMTGEFFNTFLIPSIVHQDPHYHRMPTASYTRRIFHAIDQVVWTQGDNGKGMLNYANLVGFAIDDEIGNLYVPGRETNASATAQRYAIGLATAPIDNFITEFLPDVAKHIHVQVVIVQRIINQVASKDSGGF
jgi:hypothetical protein